MACNFNPTEDRVSLEASHLCFNDWVCMNKNPRDNKSSFSNTKIVLRTADDK